MGIKKDQAGELPSVQAQITTQINAEAAGGFPPIAFYGDMISSPQTAVAGCSYFHDVASCSLGILNMPAPNDGDEVGLGRTCNSSAIQMCFGIGVRYRRINCQTTECNQCLTINTPGPHVWRYSLARTRWEVIQANADYTP